MAKIKKHKKYKGVKTAHLSHSASCRSYEWHREEFMKADLFSQKWEVQDRGVGIWSLLNVLYRGGGWETAKREAHSSLTGQKGRKEHALFIVALAHPGAKHLSLGVVS